MMTGLPVCPTCDYSVNLSVNHVDDALVTQLDAVLQRGSSA